MTKPVSQQEVARLAQVSQKTVSLALNKDSRISAKTQKAVRAAAKRLGYRPNPLLTALMTNIRRRCIRYRATVGVIMSQPTEAQFRHVPNLVRILDGLYARAKYLGYGIEEFWIARDSISPDQFHRLAYTRNINGLVIMTPHEYFDFPLKWSKFATAGIGCVSRYPVPIHNAFTQSFKLVRTAWTKLLSLGFRRIGLVANRYDDKFLDEGLSGPCYAQQALLPAAQRVPLLLEESCDQKSFIQWYRRHRPEVILCHHTDPLHWLCRHSVRVPEDVSLVHLAWNPLLKTWAGIDRQNEIIGARGLDLVVEQLNANERGIPQYPKMVLVGDKWVDGPSLSKPGAAAASHGKRLRMH
jgi:DNA-binding LacI/PurR family transcriptional regulator